jgi:hypothetical protein
MTYCLTHGEDLVKFKKEREGVKLYTLRVYILNHT